ncbi:hypothetical protein [Cellulomonas cellasea]|uniref:Uncharacterized protein n=2 Tax=Cellulomonas cellasea TaxID=43670 RepID=A0A0A0B695_9CELL|nr:hypothetical protein [Cellulomonas cellasea]KGM01713.1 hypothetical protein Q760_17880 [Cellulomonas cellasea DSM 20118]GEA86996.1 hypothetical protein CCE01nite_09450 [Cellulomonas cellasea]
MQTTRSRTALAHAVGASAVVVLAAGGCAAPEPPRLAVFDRPAEAQDALPRGIDAGQGRGETRFLGEAGDGLAYVARGSGDEPWCVLLVLPAGEGADGAVGSSCADDEQFAERGVWVSTGDRDGRGGAALVLPDDFTGPVDESEWRLVGANLAVAAHSSP